MSWVARSMFCGLALGVVCSLASGAMLNGDGAAIVSGNQPFDGVGWSADVEYAVYAPGSYPGSHVDQSVNYIYAYQVFASSDNSETLATMTLDLLEASGAANPGDDATYGALGGVAPLLSRIVGSSSGSVQYVLNVAGGEHSTTLLFSSPNTYTFASATLANGGVGDLRSLPTPVPEPASLSLLALGGLALLKRKRK